MKYTLAPNVQVVGKIQPNYSIEELEQEKTFYGASLEFFKAHAGPIGKAFLDAVPAEFYALAEANKLFVRLDVRVVRVKKGGLLATPGWHFDGDWLEHWPTDPQAPSVKLQRHIIGHVSSHSKGVANTRFLEETLKIECLPKELTFKVNERMEQGDLAILEAKDGDLNQFTVPTVHSSQPAQYDGIRLFFRANMWPTVNENPNIEGVLENLEIF